MTTQKAAPAKRILIVEDEAVILLTQCEMLRDLGHTVFQALSGKAALDVLAAEPVDILMTDVGLPDMSGIDLARDVAGNWPDTRIIFVTGQPRLENAEDCPVLSRAGLLTKPYDQAMLAEAIASIG